MLSHVGLLSVLVLLVLRLLVLRLSILRLLVLGLSVLRRLRVLLAVRVRIGLRLRVLGLLVRLLLPVLRLLVLGLVLRWIRLRIVIRVTHGSCLSDWRLIRHILKLQTTRLIEYAPPMTATLAIWVPCAGFMAFMTMPLPM